MKQKILLTVFSLVVSIIIYEITLGLLNLPKFYKAHSFPSQFRFSLLGNGELFYTNSPSQKITFTYESNPRGYFDRENKVVHTTNSLGFRGKEFSEYKDKNILRIAFLGDSFKFGEGAKDQDIFTQQIEISLNKESSTKKYECLNFGVGGYNTEQPLFLLKHIVVNFSPDAVVLCYTLNDVEPKLFYYEKESKSIKRKPGETYIPEGLSNEMPPASIIYKLRVSKLVWQILYRRNISKRTVQYYHALYAQTQLWNRNRQRLIEFIAFCQKNKIECYIAILPLLYELNEKYPFANLHKKVENTISNENIIIEVLPAFIGKRDTDLWVYPTDQHPNEIAHKLIAAKISKAILTTFQKK